MAMNWPYGVIKIKITNKRRHIRFSACLLILLLGITTKAYTCEPAALDWDRLYLDYDQNKDRKIDVGEWKKLIELKHQSYQWTKKVEKDDPFRLKIFHQLDKNKNLNLNEDELSQIYLYFPNPCDGWGETWGISEKPTDSWWKKLFNGF